MTSVRIIKTEDGSDSLFHEQLNETYHSIHGAVQESTHVFVKHGLEFFLERRKEVKILEVGFGTGLNALLTLRQTLGKNCTVQYTGLEAYPVEESIWTNLNYAKTSEEKEWFKKLHNATRFQWSEVKQDFQFRKLQSTLQAIELEKEYYDLIYFDAFAPKKQPEMWQITMLQKVAESMSRSSVFVTYCASGQLKRDLRTLGLNVESLPGPPGKREVMRATKTQSIAEG